MATKEKASAKSAVIEEFDINTFDFEKSDPKTWTKEQIGFAPYWSPREGESFCAFPISRDDRDPKFVRYQFKNLQEHLLCQRGPADGAEEVDVPKGGVFSVSSYVQLSPMLDFALSTGMVCPIMITAREKIKGGEGSVWLFDFAYHPSVKPKIDALRLKMNMNPTDPKALTV